MPVDQDTRELLDALLDASSHGVAICDGAGRIERWNRAAAEITGLDAAAVVGRNLGWLHRRDDAPWPADALERAAGGEIVRHGGWRTGARGRRRWCDAALRALPGPRGDGFAETFVDATADRAAGDRLREVQALVDTALRSAPIGMASQDERLRYAWAPVGAGALGGAPGVDPIGRTDEDLFPAATAARLTDAKRRVLRDGERVRMPLTVERGGEVRHYDVTLEPRRDETGPVRGVITVAFDVTDRHQAEEEVERSRARLAEAEHVARIGSWEWDIATNRVEWSDGLFAIYGLSREDFDPAYQPSRERVHPDDRERVDAAVRRSIESGEAIDLEYRIVRPDGRLRWVRGRAEVIVGDDGRPVRLAGTAQDVTEARVGAEALNAAAGELGRRAAELQREAAQAASPGDEVRRLLTARQLEILGLMAEGLNNAQIADRLYLSEGTVKWHVRKILRALGAANRTQAVTRYLAAR